MFGFSVGELIVLLVVVFIVFGAGKLPELGTALGEGIRNFKKAHKDTKALDVTEKSNSETPAARKEN